MKIIDQIVKHLFLKGCSDYNSAKVRRASRSKTQHIQLFDKLNVPHANTVGFFNPLKAYHFVKKHGFPVVIKPNFGGFSRGAYFPINNYKTLFLATLLSKLWWPISRIESYLAGKNYRVVVIKGAIMSVIERHPPFVIGDGKRTIEALIDQENAKRLQMKLHPTIQPIAKNKKMIQFLKAKQCTLQTILKPQQKVSLHNKIALNIGGVVEMIDQNTLPHYNQQLFFKLLESLGANILGIDVIAEDGIEKRFDQQKAIFLEINSRPFLKMHHFPRYGKKQNLSPYYKILEKSCLK